MKRLVFPPDVSPSGAQAMFDAWHAECVSLTDGREYWLVRHPSRTEGWIYDDEESAHKRLSSGLKAPLDAHEWQIIRVTTPTETIPNSDEEMSRFIQDSIEYVLGPKPFVHVDAVRDLMARVLTAWDRYKAFDPTESVPHSDDDLSGEKIEHIIEDALVKAYEMGVTDAAKPLAEYDTEFEELLKTVIRLVTARLTVTVRESKPDEQNEGGIHDKCIEELRGAYARLNQCETQLKHSARTIAELESQVKKLEAVIAMRDVVDEAETLSNTKKIFRGEAIIEKLIEVEAENSKLKCQLAQRDLGKI